MQYNAKINAPKNIWGWLKDKGIAGDDAIDWPLSWSDLNPKENLK